MKKKLQILSLEGVDFIGKTSVLSNIRMNGNVPIMSYTFDKEDFLSKINEFDVFLTENPNGLILFEGSLARVLAEEDFKKDKFQSMISEHEQEIKAWANLSHKYSCLNILMKSNDYEFIEDRIISHNTKLGIENEPKYTWDFNNLELFFRNFEQNCLSINFKYSILEITPNQRILNIYHSLIKKIEETHYLC